MPQIASANAVGGRSSRSETARHFGLGFVLLTVRRDFVTVIACHTRSPRNSSRLPRQWSPRSAGYWRERAWPERPNSSASAPTPSNAFAVVCPCTAGRTS
jgi:hypothetical protein